MDDGLGQERYTLSFPARETAARVGIQNLATALRSRGLSKECVADVEIALAEAINNIIEHAYAGQAAGRVLVICSLGGDSLDILITDRGRGFPKGRLPQGRPARIAVPAQNLPEGGFGWHLIRQLASEIRYERCDGLNRLSLTFHLTSDPSQPSRRDCPTAPDKRPRTERQNPDRHNKAPFAPFRRPKPES
ncbi:ATP-binding protein [Cribrihabitans sp. XS_ASV171]